MSNPLPLPPVPAALVGVWQRTLLEGEGFARDTVSQVFWLQTRHWHGDLRLPQQRPDFTACSRVTDCHAAQHDWLARQQGFAGLTRVWRRTSPDAPTSRTPPATYCEWHRQVDFQPRRGGRDYARIVIVEDGQTLEEYGVDAAYHETWRRVPASRGVSGAWRRAPSAGGRYPDLLLMAGACFFHLRDRPRPLDAAPDLVAALATAGDPGALDMELSFGTWNAAERAGHISHSTLPWREGKALELEPSWVAMED